MLSGFIIDSVSVSVMSKTFWPSVVFLSYETIRQWCYKFGPSFAKSLRRRQGRLGDTWFLDEVLHQHRR